MRKSFILAIFAVWGMVVPVFSQSIGVVDNNIETGITCMDTDGIKFIFYKIGVNKLKGSTVRFDMTIKQNNRELPGMRVKSKSTDKILYNSALITSEDGFWFCYSYDELENAGADFNEPMSACLILYNVSKKKQVDVREIEFTMADLQETPNGETEVTDIEAEDSAEDNPPAVADTGNTSLDGNLLQAYGLGKNQTKENHLERNYDWYIDQKSTGEHNYENCGPTATTMAIKWIKESFDKSAEDARAKYRAEGGWWYTSDVTNYLNAYSVPNFTIEGMGTKGTFTEYIDANDLIILCIDMSKLTLNENPNQRVDGFFSGTGHFILLKGYRVVDGKLYYEAYDPNSWGSYYNDGTPKGKNRYYKHTEIKKAMEEWWNYAIVVTKYASKAKRGINTKTIPDKSGA